MWSTVIIVGVYKKNYYYQKKLPLILNFKPISFLSLSSDRLIFFSIYYAILRFILLLPILCFFHYLSFLTDGHESYYISFCSPILYSYSPLFPKMFYLLRFFSFFLFYLCFIFLVLSQYRYFIASNFRTDSR